MSYVEVEYQISERHACRRLGLARSTHRYQARRNERDAGLREWLKELAAKRMRFGYRRLTVRVQINSAPIGRRLHYGFAARIHRRERTSRVVIPVFKRSFEQRDRRSRLIRRCGKKVAVCACTLMWELACDGPWQS